MWGPCLVLPAATWRKGQKQESVWVGGRGAPPPPTPWRGFHSPAQPRSLLRARPAFPQLRLPSPVGGAQVHLNPCLLLTSWLIPHPFLTSLCLDPSSQAPHAFLHSSFKGQCTQPSPTTCAKAPLPSGCPSPAPALPSTHLPQRLSPVH